MSPTVTCPIGSGTAEGYHATSTTNWSLVVGNGTPGAFQADQWSVGDYYKFDFNSSSFTNLMLSFDQGASYSAPDDFELQTSSNGTTWNNLKSYTAPWIFGSSEWDSGGALNPAFTFGPYSLPGNTIAVRMLVEDGGTPSGSQISAGSTERIGSVLITGDPVGVPEPASLAALVIPGAIALIRRRRRYF